MERYTPDEILVATIDLQRGFMPTQKQGERGLRGGRGSGYGELPVEGAHEIVDNVNAVMAWAEENDIDRVTTQDWHPSETAHFGDGDMQWPVHCVAETDGAEFAHAFNPRSAEPYKKGMQAIDSPDQDDSYSGFNAINDSGEMLGDRIRKSKVMAVVVTGLALGGAEFDTCVDATARDIREQTDAEVIVVSDAVAAIRPEETLAIGAKMAAWGVKFATTEQIVNGEILKEA